MKFIFVLLIIICSKLFYVCPTLPVKFRYPTSHSSKQFYANRKYYFLLPPGVKLGSLDSSTLSPHHKLLQQYGMISIPYSLNFFKPFLSAPLRHKRNLNMKFRLCKFVYVYGIWKFRDQ